MLALGLSQATYAKRCIEPGERNRLHNEINWQNSKIGEAQALRNTRLADQIKAQQLYDAHNSALQDLEKIKTELEGLIKDLETVIKESRALLEVVAENEGFRHEIARQLKPEMLTDDKPLEQALGKLRSLNLPSEVLAKIETALNGLVALEARSADLAHSQLELLLAALTSDDRKASEVLFDRVTKTLNKIQSRNEVNLQKRSDEIRLRNGETNLAKQELDKANALLKEVDDGINQRVGIYNSLMAEKNSAPVCSQTSAIPSNAL
jgi:hypothetical protein